MRRLLLLALLVGCPDPEPAATLDLTERLPAGQARAGQIRDAAALFGGPAAEGRVGDYKLYNDRVQFVLQGLRDSGSMVRYGGMIIDADLVRDEGAVGRDILEDAGTALGVTRLFEPLRIDVLADGSDGGAAEIQVLAAEAPLEFLTGTFEAPDFVDDEGVLAYTTYRLEPDSYLLDIETRFVASDGQAVVLPGDLMLAAQELSAIWDAGTGLDRADGPRDFTAFVGHRGDVSVALLTAEQPLDPPPGVGLLDGLLVVAGNFAAEVVLEDHEEITHRRFLGVGPDLATLAGERLERLDLPRQEVSGQVTAPDGPVAGARVNLLVDGAPYALAMSDAEGRFTAQVPPGEVRFVTDGRHRGRFFDMPLGAAEYGPFADPSLRDAPLAALDEGVPVAAGRGIVDGLELGEPGTLILTSDGPFEVRLWPVDALEPGDERVRLSSGSARGWSRDGELEVPLEPGAWRMLVHRGPRFELYETTFTVVAGESVEVAAPLGGAIDHAGYLTGDTHIHAQPSSDGDIAISHRLVNAAGVGLQVHFGTDHDAVADYRPMLAPLGIDDVLASVVADEVSPSRRGHTNIFPLTQRLGPNGGAWLWWETIVDSTEEHVANLRANHPERFVLQFNHALIGGVAGAAGWVPGEIRQPDKWTDDFQAVELLSGSEYEDYVPLYFDLVGRGFAFTPTGASDAHDVGGVFGLSTTYMHTGFDEPSLLTDADVLDVFDRRATVVSRGVFLAMDVVPGSTVAAGTTLAVEARSPSWIVVDRLRLYKDGEMVEEVDGTTASFSLDVTEDAFFVVEAVGDTPMEPVWGYTPWAMSAAVFVDVDADGWEPSLGPMAYGSSR
ncbi:MAG: hypothetical protein EP330_30715 [Deltaproteobacteria bacterium]|nr:MAG: hypothetical protein EP330_30715 [Deltaproteobacteria bacterium]